MQYFSEDDVRASLSMKDAVAILRSAFTDFAHGKAQHQPRRRLFLDTGAILHSMTGACGRYFGTKVHSTHPKHGAWFTVLLYDAATAHPLAQFEANWLGQIRTGAISGLAVDAIAPRRTLSVGCIGSGFQARAQLEAIASVREIGDIKVWSRRADKRERFAAEMMEMLAVPVSAAATAEACATSDILVTATYAREPVIEAPAIRPGMLVLAMGSNHADRRELPGDVVTAAQIVVEDAEAARIEAGDLVMALDESGWQSVIELKDIVGGNRRIESTADRVTVFKSVGIGLADVAVAGWLFEQLSGSAAIPAHPSAGPNPSTR